MSLQVFQDHLCMHISPLRPDLEEFIDKHSLKKKFRKQAELFILNPRYPSLQTELLVPKDLRIYSFRIDRKYRAVFIFLDSENIEIVDINNHYQ